MIVAIILGTIIYMITFSKYIVDVCVLILNGFKKVTTPVIAVIKKVNYVLFKQVKKIIIKPGYFLIVNVNKKFKCKIRKYVNKKKKITEKQKNYT